MAVLQIIYIILALVAIVAQYLLYRKKPKENIYVLNMVIGVILASIAFTSFPENYSIQKLLALVFGLSGASAIFVKSKMKKAMIPKVMLSVSIIASFILLLI